VAPTFVAPAAMTTVPPLTVVVTPTKATVLLLLPPSSSQPAPTPDWPVPQLLMPELPVPVLLMPELLQPVLPTPEFSHVCCGSGAATAAAARGFSSAAGTRNGVAEGPPREVGRGRVAGPPRPMAPAAALLVGETATGEARTHAREERRRRKRGMGTSAGSRMIALMWAVDQRTRGSNAGGKVKGSGRKEAEEAARNRREEEERAQLNTSHRKRSRARPQPPMPLTAVVVIFVLGCSGGACAQDKPAQQEKPDVGAGDESLQVRRVRDGDGSKRRRTLEAAVAAVGSAAGHRDGRTGAAGDRNGKSGRTEGKEGRKRLHYWMLDTRGLAACVFCGCGALAEKSSESGRQGERAPMSLQLQMTPVFLDDEVSGRFFRTYQAKLKPELQ